MVFAADFEKLGKVENHELKPGGAEIAVTEENKAEYIRYHTEHCTARSFKESVLNNLCRSKYIFSNLGRHTAFFHTV